MRHREQAPCQRRRAGKRLKNAGVIGKSTKTCGRCRALHGGGAWKLLPSACLRRQADLMEVAGDRMRRRDWRRPAADEPVGLQAGIAGGVEFFDDVG